jgi:hypothetical protein
MYSPSTLNQYRKAHLTTLAGLIVLLAFLMSACSSPIPAAAEPVSMPDVSPEQVVQEFYYWYAGYPGNVLVDKAYQTHPSLTADFIASADSGKYQGIQADPIICAQDFADAFNAGEAAISGSTAAVRVTSSWGNEIDVELKIEDGAWKIDNFKCVPR